jgi:acetyltransferase
MGIVAEIEEDGRKKLIGVGRLIADPDLESAEYAVLITDKWQGKDLGRYLTEFCTEIAVNSRVKKVIALTTKDNKPMISVFRKLGFIVEFNEDSTVCVRKELK